MASFRRLCRHVRRLTNGTGVFGDISVISNAPRGHMEMKMNLLSKTIAGLVLAGTVVAANTASAYERWVEIVNTANTSVVDVRISHIDDPYWGPNLLWGVLYPGYSDFVEPVYHDGYCRFDIEISYADGTYANLWDVNLCAATAVVTNGYYFDVYHI